MTTPIVVEATINPAYVEVEDSGMSKSVEIGDGDVDGEVVVSLNSWSDEAEHPQFDELVGKNVRVTIEVL